MAAACMCVSPSRHGPPAVELKKLYEEENNTRGGSCTRADPLDKWIEYDTHGSNHYKTDAHPDWYHGPKYSNGQVPFTIGHWGGDTDAPSTWADWCDSGSTIDSCSRGSTSN